LRVRRGSVLKSLLRGGALFAALAAVSACSSNDTEDESTGSGGEVTVDVPLAVATPQIWLVIMDDTVDAADLQNSVATAFAQYDTMLAALSPCQARLDPASSAPVDRSLVVVHPSAADGARYDSPATIPALRWQANDQTNDGLLTWTTAARQALTAVTSPPGNFRALDAIQSSVELLSGERSAVTAEEQALLAAVPARAALAVVIALDHDDDSALDPASYVVATPPSASIDWQSLIVPGGSSCSAPTRLSAWASAESGSGVPEPQLWGCGDVSVIAYPTVDCSSPPLTGSPIAFDANGGALCEALIRIDPSAQCDASRGWADPLDDKGVRTPLIDTETGAAARVCDVLQLTGDALSACQSDATCAGCTPGWCLTRIATLTESSSLHDSTDQRLAPRFVLGSNVPNGASQLTLTCETLE
jgi:hypothetical protein